MRGLLVGLVLLGLTAAPVAADIRWKTGGVAAVPSMSPAESAGRLTELATREDRHRVVVHLGGRLTDERRQALTASGVTLLGYLGDDAWFARLSPSIDAARAVSRGAIAAVEPIATSRKLHPDLDAGIVRPWTVVPAPDGAGQEPPVVALNVMFHADVDAAHEADALIARHGGRVVSHVKSINGVLAHLPFDRIGALAAEDAVMYVEPPLPRLTEANDSNRPRTGADVAQQPPYDLSGAGVTVLVYDGGQVFAHGDFTGRLTIGQSDTSGISDHSTHVAGTIGGDGAGSGGQYKGMAPAVDIVSYGFEQPGGLQQGFLYTDPGDLEADYGEAISMYGADLSNNSIGTNTAPNGYPCDWEGNYGATGVLIDSIVGGSLGEPFRVVWANGNERQGSARCGATYLTTAPPACAKNHITVGALNSDDDSVTSFTSWGPCDDGRIKPDVSGPGCQITADGGVTSTSSSGNYNVKCGTSMASPTVAGLSALLLEHYRDTHPGAPDFRNSTLKAILANTAIDIENPGPDYKTGYGSVRVVPAIDLITEDRFVEEQIGVGEVYTLVVGVGPADTQLRVTLAWDDPPGTPNVNPVLVNDLDLRVIGPDATVYYPWTLDPANPSAPAVRTQRDDVNNIEQVVIDAPAPGGYVVEIEGVSFGSGTTQTFSVAGGPSLFNCSSEGRILAPSSVACEASLPVSVIDCDLNLDDAVLDTVAVGVTSTSEPAGENLLLSESAGPSAKFDGAQAVSQTDAPGVLWVAEGDTVAVTYLDADDGAGNTNVSVQKLLTVDCTGPHVVMQTLSDIQPRKATLDVVLDEPASLTMDYGTSCGAATDVGLSSARLTAHQIKLANLNHNTAYFYRLTLIDEAGNTTVDDNGGQCYTFQTPRVPDHYTQQFSGGVDVEGLSITFQPDASIDYYSRCVAPISVALPTDPSDGTVLPMSSATSTQVTIPGGASVSLYGTDYTSFYVGANGYLTFGVSDTDTTETIDEHFGDPRISALWDDLDPSEGGSVSWKLLGDRIAVTWQDVPENGVAGSKNTFQVEMFFDGTLRVSWLDVDTADALVGLSQGVGTDPDFFQSDLSVGSSCGPRPPAVADLQLNTAPDTPLPIGLMGGDDGLPAGMLTYRVVRLPQFGTLVDDGSGQTITSVPWDLTGGGSDLTYTPAAGLQGTDSFDYRADDGGSWPDGGSSNLGTVTVRTGGGTAPVYEFLVDDTDPGWDRQGLWEFGPPGGTGNFGSDPAAAFTGSNVLGFVLGGNYPDGMLLAQYLTTDSMNLTNRFGVHLEFQRWLGVQGQSDDATLEISINGGAWSTVWQNGSNTITDTAWTLQSFDLSGSADDTSDVALRWSMGPTGTLLSYPGWNLDDIRIVADSSGPCGGDPFEVPNVRILFDRKTVDWDEAPHPGGFGLQYDVLRSTSPSDFSGAVCVESGDYLDTRADDPTVPAAGQVLHYLIRAENDCGVGPVGFDSGGAPRSAPACP